MFFGCEIEVVVLVTQRLEKGPVEARAERVHFQRFLAGRTEDMKARRVEVNQGLDLD